MHLAANIPNKQRHRKMTRLMPNTLFMKHNKANVRTNVTMRRVRETTVAAEKKNNKYYIF